MGLFDKLINEIKSEIKTGILNGLTDEKENEPEAVPAVQTSMPSAYEAEKVYDTGDDYFEAMITEDKFPGYTIERSVKPVVFDAEAYPKCYPITYLFRKNDTPVLAVMVMNKNQSRAMISVGTYRILDANGIKYIRFYKGMENKESYVIDRIRNNLI